MATITIFIRCVFRVAELSSGFNGELFNDEVAFMVLEGSVRSRLCYEKTSADIECRPMIIIASLCLTIFHPGLVFEDALAETNWSLRKKKSKGARDQKFESVEMAGGEDSVKTNL